MAEKHFTRVDSTAFQHCLTDINAVADALGLLSFVACEQQGNARHMARVSSTLLVLAHYLDIRNEYLASIAEVGHE